MLGCCWQVTHLRQGTPKDPFLLTPPHLSRSPALLRFPHINSPCAEAPASTVPIASSASCLVISWRIHNMLPLFNSGLIKPYSQPEPVWALKQQTCDWEIKTVVIHLQTYTQKIHSLLFFSPVTRGQILLFAFLCIHNEHSHILSVSQ